MVLPQTRQAKMSKTQSLAWRGSQSTGEDRRRGTVQNTLPETMLSGAYTCTHFLSNGLMPGTAQRTKMGSAWSWPEDICRPGMEPGVTDDAIWSAIRLRGRDKCVGLQIGRHISGWRHTQEKLQRGGGGGLRSIPVNMADSEHSPFMPSFSQHVLSAHEGLHTDGCQRRCKVIFPRLPPSGQHAFPCI